MSGDEIENGIIINVTLTRSDGPLSCWLEIEFQGCNQAFGERCLYSPASFSSKHKVQSVAEHFLCRVMEIVDVNDWTHLKDKAVRVIRANGLIIALGHIVKANWFYPQKEFKLNDGKNKRHLTTCINP